MTYIAMQFMVEEITQRMNPRKVFALYNVRMDEQFMRDIMPGLNSIRFAPPQIMRCWTVEQAVCWDDPEAPRVFPLEWHHVLRLLEWQARTGDALSLDVNNRFLMKTLSGETADVQLNWRGDHWLLISFPVDYSEELYFSTGERWYSLEF